MTFLSYRGFLKTISKLWSCCLCLMGSDFYSIQRSGHVESLKRKHTHISVKTTQHLFQACFIRQKGCLSAASMLSETFQATRRVIPVCVAKTQERMIDFISQGGVIIRCKTSPVIEHFILITHDGWSV